MKNKNTYINKTNIKKGKRQHQEKEVKYDAKGKINFPSRNGSSDC